MLVVDYRYRVHVVGVEKRQLWLIEDLPPCPAEPTGRWVSFALWRGS